MSIRGLRLLCIPAIVATLTVGTGTALADDDSYIAQMTKWASAATATA